eukprot:8680624-Alexandrium_andersonii.AAC.1
MKALHSDRAQGCVNQLGDQFGFLEKMAHKISCKLGGLEEEIAGEFRRRQVRGADAPGAGVWDTY